MDVVRYEVGCRRLALAYEMTDNQIVKMDRGFMFEEYFSADQALLRAVEVFVCRHLQRLQHLQQHRRPGLKEQ